MARRNGSHFIKVPERRIDDYDHWHEQTAIMNARFLSPPATPTIVLPAQMPWLREHIAKVVGSIVIAVLTAAVMTWLGLSK
jgi:hypothetical protein